MRGAPQILYEGLSRVLPDNIHEVVQGRLHVSLTKVYDGTNILVNQFASKEEVIQVSIVQKEIRNGTYCRVQVRNTAIFV